MAAIEKSLRARVLIRFTNFLAENLVGQKLFDEVFHCAEHRQRETPVIDVSVTQQFVAALYVAANHRSPAGHRFQNDVWHAFVSAGQDQHSTSLHQRRHVCLPWQATWTRSCPTRPRPKISAIRVAVRRQPMPIDDLIVAIGAIESTCACSNSIPFCGCNRPTNNTTFDIARPTDRSPIERLCRRESTDIHSC